MFKAFFNRRRDWADVEEMLRAGRLGVGYVAGVLVEYLGPDDGRVHELLDVRDEVSGADPTTNTTGGTTQVLRRES